MNPAVARARALVRRGAALVLPRGPSPLLAALRGDRLLLWGCLGLFAAAYVPLMLTPFLPFSDLPLNTASATMLWDTALGHQPAASHYAVQWIPVPYWTTYLFTTVLARIFGPLVAAKLLAALVFALVPLGTMRLLLALGRDPRLGLWAFALGWEHNLYAGWLALLVGVAMASFILAWLIEAKTVKDGLRIAPAMALAAVTHPQAIWLLGVAGVVLVFTTGPLKTRLAVHAAAGAGMAIAVVPWLLAKVATGGGGGGAGGLNLAFTFEWHTPATKLSQFFAYTLDNFSNRDGERAAAITFVILLLGPLVLGLLPARAEAKDRRSPVALVMVAGGLYALLPWAIYGPISHWYTYPRFATVVLLWLLLIPAPRLRGWNAWALLPGIAAALLMDVKAGQQLRAFGERTRPFLQVIAQVPPKASVLPMVFDDYDPDPDLKLPPYHQFYAYVTAVRRGFDPYLWDNPSIPLVYRPDGRLPAPGWGGAFSMDAHGKAYDFILVQAFAKADPVKNAVAGDGTRPRLVLETARWRLYAVSK